MTAIDTVLAALDERDCRPRGSYERGWRSLCPAHDNLHRLSLAISYQEGKVLLKCFGGCDVEAVLGALSLEWGDLFDEELRMRNAS